MIRFTRTTHGDPVWIAWHSIITVRPHSPNATIIITSAIGDECYFVVQGNPEEILKLIREASPRESL